MTSKNSATSLPGKLKRLGNAELKYGEDSELEAEYKNWRVLKTYVILVRNFTRL